VSSPQPVRLCERNGVTGGGVSNTEGKSKESDVSVMSAGVVMAVTALNDSLIKALTSRIAARVHPSKTETGVDKLFVGNITFVINGRIRIFFNKTIQRLSQLDGER